MTPTRSAIKTRFKLGPLQLCRLLYYVATLSNDLDPILLRKFQKKFPKYWNLSTLTGWKKSR